MKGASGTVEARVGSGGAGIRRYRLGCPMWALEDWQGSLYRADGRSRTWLSQYAGVFNAVEGNTTFYAVPAPQTVARWLAQTPEHFRFCFKFPRTISHEGRLAGRGDEARAFLLRMRPLGPRLGPFMLQLPASFGPGSLEALHRFLEQLPQDVACAVELRHRRFFEDDGARAAVDTMLVEHGAERVILDSRPLRSGDMRHPEVLAAEHEKPDLPVLPAPLTGRPMVRFIAHPAPAVTTPWLARWARRVVSWMADGREPLLFMHCPNNARSPAFAREFHGRVREFGAAAGIDAGEMPPWPGEAAGPGEQLSLV